MRAGEATVTDDGWPGWWSSCLSVCGGGGVCVAPCVWLDRAAFSVQRLEFERRVIVDLIRSDSLFPEEEQQQAHQSTTTRSVSHTQPEQVLHTQLCLRDIHQAPLSLPHTVPCAGSAVGGSTVRPPPRAMPPPLPYSPPPASDDLETEVYRRTIKVRMNAILPYNHQGGNDCHTSSKVGGLPGLASSVWRLRCPMGHAQ